MYKNSHSGMGGRCMWLREIGLMSSSGNSMARDFLSKILLEPTTHENDKKITFCFLMEVATQRSEPETRQALKEFIGDPANAELISSIKQCTHISPII
ncbi:MAG: hypothetical protein HGA36_01915 [Candidatus Moranbacteria bacterium]|nr:hypothetical protein [Candidatus Moranbacteria bacterium]